MYMLYLPLDFRVANASELLLPQTVIWGPQHWELHDLCE